MINRLDHKAYIHMSVCEIMGEKVVSVPCDRCGKSHSITVYDEGSDTAQTMCGGCNKKTSWEFKDGKLV